MCKESGYSMKDEPNFISQKRHIDQIRYFNFTLAKQKWFGICFQHSCAKYHLKSADSDFERGLSPEIKELVWVDTVGWDDADLQGKMILEGW